MKRVALSLSLFAAVCMVAAVFSSGRAVEAQDGAQATITALQTRVAELKATAEARGEKINAQRTQIAELRDQVSELQRQLPPTPTPTPQLTGKDAFPYVSDPLEIFTRPFNHIGEKMSFCGTVGFIQVARPGNKLYPGDTVLTGWTTVAQIFLDGADARFMIGFNGDSSGIYEDSYVCAWGTLVDTTTGKNAFGGTIVNPLFDAEYFELVY